MERNQIICQNSNLIKSIDHVLITISLYIHSQSRARSVFKADDKQCSFETNQRSVVTVVGSAGNHESGSSKVKLKSIVDYKWDLRHYPGRLITVHIDGKHLAYAILGEYISKLMCTLQIVPL